MDTLEQCDARPGTTRAVLVVPDGRIGELGPSPLTISMDELELVAVVTLNEAAVGAVRRCEPDIVLIAAPNGCADAALALAGAIDARRLAPVALLVTACDAELARRAARAGVAACLLADSLHLRASAEVVVTQWRAIRAAERRVAELAARLQEGKVLERARGLLMDQYHISADEAARRLRAESARSSVPVEVAARAVLTAHAVVACSR